MNSLGNFNPERLFCLQASVDLNMSLHESLLKFASRNVISNMIWSPMTFQAQHDGLVAMLGALDDSEADSIDLSRSKHKKLPRKKSEQRSQTRVSRRSRI